MFASRFFLTVYMTGGSDEALYCELKKKKIREAEILHQKYNWHQNFLSQKIQDLNRSTLIQSNGL